MIKKLTIFGLIWIALTAASILLLFRVVELHSYQLYSEAALCTLSPFVFYVLGIIGYKPKRELVKECPDCHFFIPLGASAVIDHCCRVEKKLNAK